ncbi:uncharacterized protein LOC129780638 [Toxorhynchites rutilus septentrionalis]|uniref:uncharacterized protein LOC129780638 n=1 Tax=Toxorhynchites rutilus septentrionalis TaxID=329112 RepID=UPI00247AA4D3|nr:uncharacterized protein LOC129780638 [Toxorhynchites rutilus septentrionalis]
MDVETTGSITMEDSLGQRDEGAHAVERILLQDPVYPPLSPVNVRTYYEFLEEPTTGVIPKVIKNETLYEKWRSETHNIRRLQDLKAEHKKENDIRRNRELDLIEQMKQMELQKREELEDQRAKEADLKAKLEQREREQALIEERKQNEMAAVQNELKRLRTIEQRFLQQNYFHRQQQMVDGHLSGTEFVPDGLCPRFHQRAASVINVQSSVANNRPAGTVGNTPVPLRTNMPPVSVQNLIPNNLPHTQINTSPSYLCHSFIENGFPSPISTPMGDRSCYNITETPPILPSPHVASGPPNHWSVPSSFVINPPMSSSEILSAEVVPSSQQLAARQVVSKDLPVFSGDPVDWPLFYSSYQHSTQVCGYSNSENLLRLQRSLKGRAREAVSSFLLHPTTIPQVISTLQTLFGRPEHIIHNMISKVRAIPAPRADRLESLVSFGLAVQNLCGHLKAIRLEKHLSNPMLLQELVDKLPANVKLSWALHQEQVPMIDLSVFGEYMGKIVSATSSVTGFSTFSQKPSKDSRSNEKAYVNSHTTSNERVGERDENAFNHFSDKQTTGNNMCLACGVGIHQVARCLSFKRLSLDDRWKLVKEYKLCRRCLTPHVRWPCKGEACGINGCQKKHHRLLHSDCPLAATSSTQKSTNATVTVHRQVSSSTLFRVLPVTLYGKNGQVNTLAFLDDGSSITLVEQSLVNELGVNGPSESLCIQWTGGVKKQIADTNRIQLQISAVGSNKRFKLGEAYTVEDLGLPEQSLDFSDMSSRFKHLEGVPVQSFDAAAPGVLIGLNNTHLLFTLKLREGRPNEPIATKTRIGWSVYGSQRGTEGNMQHRQLHICAKTVDENLHDYVKNFFSVESLGVALVPQVEGVDEQRARRILEETTVRTTSGRLQTGLIWKYDGVELPDSRPLAEKRLRCLEKRLSRDPVLYSKVRQQMSDYLEKGYSHKATVEELSRFDPRRTWYLPIGIVLNPRKPDKVRVIWDAAAKVEGISLNSMLLKGPDLLTSLLSVLFGYREREVAISGDLKEMFHQLLIREEDRCALLFLWRNYPEMPIEVMVMNVAIFGASCSPTQAIFAMNLNAEENEVDHPRAAIAIKHHHYMDDYLDSVDTDVEAVKLALEVAEVHSKAGFEIRNWLSNKKTVLEKIGEMNPKSVKCFTTDKEMDKERLLGMIWLPEEDVFSFALSFREDLLKIVSGETIPTKREMLKVTMSIFDPLGIVAAFVIHGKVLVQDVWRSKIDWDEKIPWEIFCRWKQWLSVLRKMNTVKVDRCYFPGYNPDCYNSLNLHVFIYAGEEAYAAAAYFRVVDNGRVRCILVSSKTKVAPLQPLSIPRLELQAAVLGARLRKTIEEKHSLKIQRTFFWSDSSTVIAWIKSDARRYRQFVAFRVNEILSLSSVQEWRWVPTKLNVADEATKWGKGPSFDPDSRWYRGPKFLYDSEHEWPRDCREENSTTAEELRSAFVHKHHVIEQVVKLERFSRLERLLRSMAYVVRFIDSSVDQRKTVAVGRVNYGGAAERRTVSMANCSER